VREFGALVADVEGREKPLSEQAARQSLARHGVHPGKDHKVDLAAAFDARAKGKREDLSALDKNDETSRLKARKLGVEVEILELKRDIARGEYVSKSEHRLAMAELCTGIVSAVENFRRRKDARDRDPKKKKILDETIAEVRNALADSVARLGVESVSAQLYEAACKAVRDVRLQQGAAFSEGDLARLNALKDAVRTELAAHAKKLGLAGLDDKP
jgi:hypothetical protein